MSHQDWESTTYYMVPIKKYVLLHGPDCEKMNALIQEYIDVGYRPHGSPSYNNMSHDYLQGMILYGEGDE